MNKTKKVAIAVVSLVLASSMCLSVTACNTRTLKVLSTSQEVLEVSTDDDGNLSYTSGIGLNMNVGYKATDMPANIAYTSGNFTGTVTMPDGVKYSNGSLKPAWQGLQEVLDVTFTDSYTNMSDTEQITTNLSTGVLNNYNVVTGGTSTITTQASASSDQFLDLSLYLDYMPNFKKFLTDNPIVYMSLTSDTDTGAIYYMPYFDGNDDIEDYVLAKKNWMSVILDSTTQPSDTLTFKDQVEAKAAKVNNSGYGYTSTEASCESFMGTTGSWWIESTDPDDEDETVTITVSYDKALEAANDSTTALGKALTAAGVTVGNLTSGNIVDLQNAAINATSGEVTGAQLTSILQAYVDVAYLDSNGNTYYSTRSDVFNGYDAAWDVDLLVAMMRCVCCYNITNLNTYSNGGTYTDNTLVYGLTGRESTAQRMNNMFNLAGELYGVRGLESRYTYTYVDENGDLQNARADLDSYEALDKMHKMTQEGLYNADDTSGVKASDSNSYYKSGTCEALMQYDYVQTQTATGGFTDMGLASGQIEDGYNYAPIVTPVSKWDDGSTSTKANVDGISYDYDGDYKYMRFTESWRSVKSSAAAIPRASVENDPEKLAAVLAFVDYFYSNDGQILMSFGTQSSTNNCTGATSDYTGTSDDGWWYATEVTNVSISSVATMVGGQYYINSDYASQYFCYNNKLYTGTYYKGKQYPTVTNSNLAFYYGKSVNGTAQSQLAKSAVRSYTNYARYMIGACLPIGNKLQAFEYQCTSQQGINGANIVAAGLTNGTIAHVYQQVGSDNGKGYWYTEVTSTLPYANDVANWISNNANDLDNTVFASSSSNSTNFYIDITYYGLTSGHGYQPTYFESVTLPATAQACIDLLNNSYNLSAYVAYMQEAWADISGYYDDYISFLL